MKLEDIHMEGLEWLKERLIFYFKEDSVSIDWVKGYLAGLYKANVIWKGIYILLTDWLKEKEELKKRKEI